MAVGRCRTIVHIYGADRPEVAPLYEVEFMNRTGAPANGATVAVETLNANEVRAVDLGRVMLHYNDVARAA